MNTSLGNGYTNWVVHEFVHQKIMSPPLPFAGCYEGDDSATSFLGSGPTAEDFARVGFTIKQSTVLNLNEVSFCGLVFDPDDNVVITDVSEALVSFGWAMSSYVGCKKSRLLTLLRCKAMSYAYQYPGCPILGALSQYALRMTSGIDVRSFIENDRAMSLWDRDQLREALTHLGTGRVVYREPPIKTRLLVEKLYQITVAQQISCEDYLFRLDSLQPLAGPILEIVTNPIWSDYYQKYSWKTVDRSDLRYPRTSWMQYDGFVPEFEMAGPSEFSPGSTPVQIFEEPKTQKPKKVLSPK